MIDSLIEFNTDLTADLRAMKSDERFEIEKALAKLQGWTNMDIVRASNEVITRTKVKWLIYRVSFANEKLFEIFKVSAVNVLPKLKMNIVYAGGYDGLPFSKEFHFDEVKQKKSVRIKAKKVKEAKEKLEGSKEGEEQELKETEIKDFKILRTKINSFKSKQRTIKEDGKDIIIPAQTGFSGPPFRYFDEH